MDLHEDNGMGDCSGEAVASLCDKPDIGCKDTRESFVERGTSCESWLLSGSPTASFVCCCLRIYTLGRDRPCHSLYGLRGSVCSYMSACRYSLLVRAASIGALRGMAVTVVKDTNGSKEVPRD